MHPTVSELILQGNGRNLERGLRHAHHRRRRSPVPVPPADAVMLRLCRVQDNEVLDRLAELDSAPPPKGQHVLAEVRGVVVAALPLAGGRVIADPFWPTAHLIPLLELRAKQLADDRPRGRSRPLAFWRATRGWSRA